MISDVLANQLSLSENYANLFISSIAAPVECLGCDVAQASKSSFAALVSCGTSWQN